MSPMALLGISKASLYFLNIIQKWPNIFFRPDIFNGHAEKFFPGIAILKNRGVIYIKETEGLIIIYPFWKRAFKKKVAVFFFTFNNCFFSLFAFRNIFEENG